MPAVGLDLGFARSTQESEAAALPLEVGPAPDQAARLIVEMRELDLQSAFGGRRPLAEDLEDQTGAVDHLRADLLLQILLLDRGQRRIDNEQTGSLLFRRFGDLLDLPFAKQRRGPHFTNAQRPSGDDIDADRRCQALRFLDTRFGRAARAFAPELGNGDDRALAASDLDRAIAVEIIQDSLSSSPSAAAPRLSGCAGCRVEMACL